MPLEVLSLITESYLPDLRQPMSCRIPADAQGCCAVHRHNHTVVDFHADYDAHGG